MPFDGLLCHFMIGRKDKFWLKGTLYGLKTLEEALKDSF